MQNATSGADANRKPTFFSEEYWSRFADIWNAAEFRQSLAGLGVVRFEVTEHASDPAYMYWDKDGVVKLVDETDRSVTRFSATLPNWHSFISGELPAAKAVIQGRIVFRGNLIHINRYRTAFEHLAEVARAVEQ